MSTFTRTTYAYGASTLMYLFGPGTTLHYTCIHINICIYWCLSRCRLRLRLNSSS